MISIMNDRGRRLSVYIMIFLIIFLISNIIVQSVYIQEVNAVPVVLPQLLENYLPEFLLTIFAVTGVLFAPEEILLHPEKIPGMFWGFISQYYEDYMASEIEQQWTNFMDFISGTEQVSYNDIPYEVRKSVLDFADTMTAAIGEEGVYNSYQLYTVSYEGPVEITDITIPLNSRFEIVFQGENPYFSMNTGGSLARQWILSKGESDLSVMFKYHKSDISAVWYTVYGQEIEDYTNVSMIIQNEGIYIDGVRLDESNPAHNPVYTDIPNATLNIEDGTDVLVITSVFVDSLDGQAIDGFGEEWRDNTRESIDKPIVPPWFMPGQDLYFPNDLTVDDVTGDVSIDDFTVPSETPTEYPSDWTGDVTVGDLPVDMPAESSGSWVNKLLVPFEGMQDKFPFSLPWDVQRLLSYFDQYEENAPSFEVPMQSFIIASSGHITDQVFEFNLDFLQDYVPYIRLMEIILADLMLIMWLLRHFVSG